MRIIGGKYKGLKLLSPNGTKIRPTSDRLKESLFSIITSNKYKINIDGSDVLDICSGSGSLGIEAFSRGAISIHFIDKDQKSINLIYKNIAKFSMYLSIVLSFLVFVNFYESSSDFFNLIGNEVLNNVIIFLYISAGVLSFGSYKSLQEKSYTGVMASTGLSYLSLIVSLGASGTLILSIWHYP